MDNSELIEQARALCEGATPGPWRYKETADYSEIYDNHSWGKALSPLAMVGSNLDDAAFIAASSTLVPQLCDALEAMTARAEKAEAERDTYTILRPAKEWHEDLGDCLWWNLPIDEPPYCGSPLDSEWPGYHTYFTKLPLPEPPKGE